VSVAAVFLAALVTALATGLGALPLLLGRRIERVLGLGTALAAGFMAGASAGLVWEGVGSSLWRTFTGFALGVLFIVATTRALGHRHHHAHFGALRGADALGALMIVGVMTLHSFTEGIGVGVSFGEGAALGTLIATAIAVHNIPEGLAISLVLVPRGVSVARAAAWSVFSSLPQPLMAVPAFLLVEWFEPILPVGLGFAAGAMTWMVVAQLVPDALRTSSPRSVAAAVGAAGAAMVGLQVVLLG
jgi:ZIP family zinc transporter